MSLICFGFSGQSQTIEKFSIDSGGSSALSGGINILYTIGEVNVQEASVNTIILSEGFINPEHSSTLSIGNEVGINIEFFPNPVSQTLYISTNQSLVSISLYDILGKQVYTSKHTNHIDVRRYQQGIYLLKVKTNIGFTTKKIIIN
jgi:hypothetical protein